MNSTLSSKRFQTNWLNENEKEEEISSSFNFIL